MADLRLVLPTINLRVGYTPLGPVVYAVGMLGCEDHGGVSANAEVSSARGHIGRITRQLHSILTKKETSARKDRLLARAADSPYGKTHVAAVILECGGPSLEVALGCVSFPGHAAALAGFITGEFFLGRYAGNYFAKGLLPSQNRHRGHLHALGLEASWICLHCWTHERILHLEDEAHMIFDCGLLLHQRRTLLTELTRRTWQIAEGRETSSEKLTILLQSMEPQDWQALSKFLARARQMRRRSLELLRNMEGRLQKNIFETHIRPSGRRLAGAFAGMVSFSTRTS